MDRFSGPKLLERKLFTTEEKAKDFVRNYNSGNNKAVVPEYYTVASYSGLVGNTAEIIG